MPRKPTGRRLVRRQGDEDRGGECGLQLVAADERERLGHGRVGREDDRLGGHQSAGGVGAVLAAARGRPRPLRAPSARAASPPRSSGSWPSRSAASSGSIASRMSAARSSPSGFEDVHLLVLGHLLERVGEPVVGELLGDLDEALLGQVEQGVREVGGLQLGVGRDELLGGLRLAGHDLLAHLGPRREGRRSLREGRGAGLRATQEELADVPLAEAVALDRDVLDDGDARAVAEGRPCVRASRP